MSSLDSFRQETREWLEENCPQSMRSPMTNVENDQCWGGRKWTFKSEDQKLWMERMGAKGWTAPDWPKEYGGGGHLYTREGPTGRLTSRLTGRLTGRPTGWLD